MRVPPRAHRTNRLIGWLLLPAVLLACALGGPAGASAASVAPAAGPAAEDHTHHCRCATRCRGASCCCGPRTARAPVARPNRADASPCVSPAPCHDPGAPSVPAAGPSAKAATLAAIERPAPDASARWSLPASRCLPPARRPSRLDEPPERPAVA